MSYFFSATLTNTSFEAAIEQVTAALKKEGFGILTEIDVQATFKKKLDIDFKRYQILGACNPTFAHKAILAEDKIGVFLPCNVVVSEGQNGSIHVTAVDPIASMISVKNDSLGEIATQVQASLKRVIETL